MAVEDTKFPRERCRICLDHHCLSMSLHEEIEIDGYDKELISKILLECGNLVVTEDDNKPQTICLFCIEKAKDAYKFKLSCMKSNEILRNELDDLLDLDNVEYDNSYNDIKIEEITTSPSEENLTSSSHNSSTVEYNLHEILLQLESTNLSCKCGKTFSNERMLDKHKRTHICRYCGYLTLDPKDLSKHLQEQHADHKNIVCTDCGKQFFRKSQLNLHVVIHNGLKPHTCDECGLSFALRGNLTAHIKHVHKEEKTRFICSECGKSFGYKESLKCHMASHTKSLNFTCDICGAAFSRRRVLNGHKKRHQNNRRYKCTICEKLFNTNNELKRHNMIHTGIKNYECEVCNKRFVRTHHLKTHMRVHTGEKPNICHVCGKGFNQAVSLRTHLKTHHDNDTS